jgi:xylulokinase
VLLLGLDIGTSSIKAGLLRNGHVVEGIVQRPYPTRFEGPRAEVEPAILLGALAASIKDLGALARRADAVAMAVMSPAWVAMDRRGEALTPLVTHQDRRSVDVARELEQRVGKERHLQLAGNRPFPGGISSTTLAWFLKHAPAVMRRADLVGHLNTFLHRTLTGGRVIDPSNASFTGLFATLQQSGWSDELCAAVGISPKLLPDIFEAHELVGRVTPGAARRFGLIEGIPVAASCVDTSAAMLLTGARVGQLLNVIGSTDVLGLCTDRPVPHERLLTRALGVGPRWMSVSTLAAAGSAFEWTRAQLFRDVAPPAFWRLIRKLASHPPATGVTFEPHLAGERTSIEQRQAAFTGLTLATTREHMLSAVIEALARESAARLPLLAEQPVRIRHAVVLSGGGARHGLREVLHRDWPGTWMFTTRANATLRGLSALINHPLPLPPRPSPGRGGLAPSPTPSPSGEGA